MNKFFKAITAVALASAGSANAGLIVNGSFEDGPAPGVFTTLGNGNNSITGWTVGGSIDYIGSYWVAQDGSRSLDLAGSSAGSISQTFATVIGRTYNVTYWVSKNPDGGVTPRTGFVSAGEATGGFSFGVPNSNGNMNWAKETFSFKAVGNSTTLSFGSDDTAGCCYGPALDNVSVAAAVPEPSAWALLILGFGLIGAGMRRPRSRSEGAFAA